MSDERPALSVVLMVDRQRARGVRCLASLLDQEIVPQIEVVLAGVGDADARFFDYEWNWDRGSAGSASY